MPISLVVGSCAGIFLLAAAVEAAMRKEVQRFLLQLAALATVLVLAFWLKLAISGTVAFGDDSFPLAGIVAVAVAALLGIAARFVFDLPPGQFSWLEFVKPLAITPIVLLPLIGSLQGMGQLKSIQILSLALLAFQNGFF